MNNRLIRISKFLSLVLRHRPQKIGLSLDEGGWASVDELLSKALQSGVPLDRETLLEVVSRSDKQRFAMSDDGQRIRANQGHSIPVDLGLEPLEPPARLFHGTSLRSLESIKLNGLKRGKRHHVHLSDCVETALKVGGRHGKPVVLTVLSGAMYVDGYEFYLSSNRIWLVIEVPATYLLFP